MPGSDDWNDSKGAGAVTVSAAGPRVRALADPPTTGRLLRVATERLREARSETARLDAELLMGHVTGRDRTALLAHPELELDRSQVEAFRAVVDRRAAGEPVAYIRGWKEFYGLRIAVDGRVLIPRPETEQLVERGAGWLEALLREGGSATIRRPIAVRDVGTGSGAIAVALGVLLRRAGLLHRVRLLATDASAGALVVARRNGQAHGLTGHLGFGVANLLEPPVADLVLANLPYVPSDAIAELPVAASYEPRLALDGGPDGLDLVRGLLDALPRALGPGGLALLEIGADQVDALRAEVRERLSGWELVVHDDLAGRARIAALRRQAEPHRLPLG